MLFSVIFRTIFFYIFITISYRLMGKREIGKLGVIDLIVSILIAEMVAISIENLSDPIYLTVVPISILVILEILLAYLSTKNNKVRILLEGKPSLIIVNGKINYNEMLKQRYTMDDLLLQLRLKEIEDISQVEYAFLENSGNLSVFKYKPFKLRRSFPLPIIVDGIINEDSIKYLKKSKDNIENALLKENLKVSDIFYAFYKKNKLYIIKKRS